ncbi:adenosylcobinamide-GDP ribazoletransferase [Dysgonomonas sp. Marseille-P4361]|uniref:adenosylcobinamide-GDP ribazoletransferase n=1 Tax=Dysgonomonas sp. Marseille-P4361 TaxID=2161820 RepID=UPI000D54CB75|nr:adenosylcobinamide-GDP ribazoletransferase [Dysgonomonas sp. Marseille-P4361]
MKDIAAAFVFFTRLPLWRLKAFNVSMEHYKQVINYWPVVGWLTAIVMVSVLWLSAQVLPFSIAVLLAIISRLLITGTLHEDGLADFFDGFGGGATRERILAIMKDSHIGTYGVLSLVVYFMMLYTLLNSMDLQLACIAILTGDPLCKLIASQITLLLPYARTEETSKAKVVYNKMSVKPFIISLFFGLFPLLFLMGMMQYIAVIFPILIFFILVFLIKRKIGGYAGDCCGALFLVCELSFYLGTLSVYNIFRL